MATTKIKPKIRAESKTTALFSCPELDLRERGSRVKGRYSKGFSRFIGRVMGGFGYASDE